MAKFFELFLMACLTVPCLAHSQSQTVIIQDSTINAPINQAQGNLSQKIRAPNEGAAFAKEVRSSFGHFMVEVEPARADRSDGSSFLVRINIRNIGRTESRILIAPPAPVGYDLDFNSYTASKVAGVPLCQVNKTWYSNSKLCAFNLSGGAKRLSSGDSLSIRLQMVPEAEYRNSDGLILERLDLIFSLLAISNIGTEFEELSFEANSIPVIN